MGVIHTVKRATPKGYVSVAYDDHRRGREIAVALVPLLESVVLVCSEAMSMPPHKVPATKLARGWGVIDAMVAVRDLPMLMASPQVIKEHLTGSKGGSKNLVQKTLRDTWPSPIAETFVAETPERFLEHAFDAWGAIKACETFPEFQLLRRILGPGYNEPTL